MLWDIAGSMNYRKVWHSYISDASLVVFMIDGANHDKKAEDRTVPHQQERTEGLTQDKDEFNLLPWDDIIQNCTKGLTCKIFIEETSCLG
jgi:GTPase SAR1 family protein